MGRSEKNYVLSGGKSHVLYDLISKCLIKRLLIKTFSFYDIVQAYSGKGSCREPSHALNHYEMEEPNLLRRSSKEFLAKRLSNLMARDPIKFVTLLPTVLIAS